jgi:hypothetical protein
MAPVFKARQRRRAGSEGYDGLLFTQVPSEPEDAPVKYAIMSNLTVIQMNLTGTRRASSN